MINKHCVNCKKNTPHNAMKKADNFRCTNCGYPVGNQPGSGRKEVATAFAAKKAAYGG